MDVTLVGTGTLVPEPGRGSTSLLVEKAGLRLPFDLGRGALAGLAAAGVDPLRLRRWFLSHLHADHTAELVSLLFALRHARAGRGPVGLVGPVGLGRLVERIVEAWPSTKPDYALEVEETGGGVLLDAGLRVTAGPVHHGGHAALGYRVEDPATGRSCAFTGDTGPGPDLLALVRGVDLLVAECGDGLRPGRGRHLDVSSLARVVLEGGVGRVAIIHVDPRHDRAAVISALRDLLGERVVAGRDGLRIPV